MVLSDLPTADVGIVGFWNALNHGASSIDPTEVLTHANITSFTQESNGVEGEYEESFSNKTREFNFRVKSDGWFIVYIDRTNNFGTNIGGAGSDGYYDAMADWTAPGNPVTALPETKHSQIINALRQELSNTGSITFNHSDVGYFTYEFPDATTMTFISEQTANNTLLDGGLSYTSGTIRHYHAAGAQNNVESNPVTFGGTNIYDGGGTGLGVRDVLAAGLMPNAGVVVSQSGDPGNQFVIASHAIIYQP